MEVSKIPWWVGLPASVGFGVMGAVATTFLPVWVQAVLFALGGLAVLWSFIAGAWHFGVGKWLSRNVWWRFGRRHPAALIAATASSDDNGEARLIWQAIKAKELYEKVAALPYVKPPERLLPKTLAEYKGPNDGSSPLHRFRDTLAEGRPPATMVRTLEEMGVDVAPLKEKIAEREAAIKMDAAYLFPSPGDPYHWPSMHDKRTWHLWEAQANCINPFLGETRNRLKAEWDALEAKVKEPRTES